jgi:cysteine desulfurase
MDNHSTTRLDPRVVEVMLPFLTEQYGNAASKSHAFGWMAQAAVDRARGEVAALLGANASEVFFTSGATESVNLAIKGVAWAYASRGRHIVTAATEHKAGLDAATSLESSGFEVTVLGPDRSGLFRPEEVAAAVTDKTSLVSIMHANNEIGVVQPIVDIARAVKEKNARCLFHTDAAQSAAVLPMAPIVAAVDLVSLSAHKMYGPKGVGALWVRGRPRVLLEPLFHGGGHEGGRRSGTLAVPNVVGFGKAATLALEAFAAEAKSIAQKRDRLRQGILSALDGVTENGAREPRLPGNLNLSFAGVDGAALLVELAPKIAVSSGAACSSADAGPSYVLKAIGVPDELAQASIRFGLGRFTTDPDIDAAIVAVRDAVTLLRQLSY